MTHSVTKYDDDTPRTGAGFGVADVSLTSLVPCV